MYLTRALLISMAVAFLHMAQVCSETVLKESFEEQGKWQKKVSGKGSVELVDGGVEGKCLKVSTNDHGLVYYSIPLDVQRVKGKKIIVRAKVKLDNVTQGEQSYATAKLHIGARAGKDYKNYAQRFTGTKDWHDQILVAEIPENVDSVTLDLGIQNGNGTAWYDDLVIDDGVKQQHVVSMKTVANASCGQAGLGGMPIADLRLAEVDFYVMSSGENYGRSCVMLRGVDRPDLPARIETVIPVDQKGARLFFLQAFGGAGANDQAPCLVYSIHYSDGKSVEAPMRAETDIGPLKDPKSLPNWKVGWTSKEDGGTVGLGVAEWKNPRPDVPIQFIRLSTPGTGAVPIVVAISLDPGRK